MKNTKKSNFDELRAGFQDKPRENVSILDIEQLQQAARDEGYGGVHITFGTNGTYNNEHHPPFIIDIELCHYTLTEDVSHLWFSLRFGINSKAEAVASAVENVEPEMTMENNRPPEETLKSVNKTLLPMDLANSINVSPEEKMFIDLVTLCAFIDLPDERKLHHLKRIVNIYEANLREKK